MTASNSTKRKNRRNHPVLGAILKIRLLNQLSRQAVANEMGIGISKYKALETGISRIDLELVELFCKTFGIDLLNLYHFNIPGEYKMKIASIEAKRKELESRRNGDKQQRELEVENQELRELNGQLYQLWWEAEQKIQKLERQQA